MVTVCYGGRLGNNMFQYAAGYIFAKKHQYKIDTPASFGAPYYGGNFFNDFGKFFNIDTSFGKYEFKEPEYPFYIIKDPNLMDLMSIETVVPGHYIFQDWLQIKEHVLKYRKEMKEMYNPQYLERDPKEMIVVVRLGEIAGWRAALPLEYYIDAIERINFTKGYITSDSMEHPIVTSLIQKYKLIPYYQKDPLAKLDFAKDFNQMVLSEGTYCWWIGALSRAETIICNNRNDVHHWHGDIFVYPEWTKLHHDRTI